MELKCTDCMVTFEAPYDKDCPFCGTDAFVVEITNQPKLSIPKKIADWLDKAFEEYKNDGYAASTILASYIIKNITKDESIEKWFDDFYVKKLDLATAYLVGKALGVELVEVTDE